MSFSKVEIVLFLIYIIDNVKHNKKYYQVTVYNINK